MFFLGKGEWPPVMSCHLRMAGGPLLLPVPQDFHVPVVQWSAHQTFNLGMPGSIPAGDAFSPAKGARASRL